MLLFDNRTTTPYASGYQRRRIAVPKSTAYRGLCISTIFEPQALMIRPKGAAKMATVLLYVQDSLLGIQVSVARHGIMFAIVQSRAA
jgi:hypothetical protein